MLRTPKSSLTVQRENSDSVFRDGTISRVEAVIAAGRGCKSHIFGILFQRDFGTFPALVSANAVSPGECS